MNDNDDTSPSEQYEQLRIAFVSFADAIRAAGQLVIDAFLKDNEEWNKAIAAFKKAADAAIEWEQAQIIAQAKWEGYLEERKQLKQEDRLYERQAYAHHARKDIYPTKNRKAPDTRFTQQHYSRN